MKKCPRCNHINDDDAEYCVNCGCKVENKDRKYRLFKNKYRKYVLITTALVILLIAAGILYFILNKVVNTPLTPSATYTLKVESNDSILGTVSGGGKYKVGKKASLKAIVNPNASFIHWEENGTVISDNQNYDFTMPKREIIIKGVFKETIIPVCSLSLNIKSLTLKKNTSATLEVSIHPGSATNKSIEWSSSDTSIATVNASGLVTAVAEKGTAYIIATATDGGKTDTCKVTLPPPPECTKNCTKYYPFGKYVGELKNGFPQGEGTMYYTKRVQIAKHASGTYCAESGYRFKGRWYNGDIYYGKLYRNDNDSITIFAGQLPTLHDISKDVNYECR